MMIRWLFSVFLISLLLYHEKMQVDLFMNKIVSICIPLINFLSWINTIFFFFPTDSFDIHATYGNVACKDTSNWCKIRRFTHDLQVNNFQIFFSNNLNRNSTWEYSCVKKSVVNLKKLIKIILKIMNLYRALESDTAQIQELCLSIIPGFAGEY